MFSSRDYIGLNNVFNIMCQSSVLDSQDVASFAFSSGDDCDSGGFLLSNVHLDSLSGPRTKEAIKK